MTEVTDQAVAPRPASTSHRLHPLTPLARSWQVFVILLAVFAQDVARNPEVPAILLVLAVALPVVLGYGFLTWWFTHYRIEGGDLYVETGVLFRRSRRVHLARLQAVDVVRPLVARLLGLAELRLEVAGGEKTEAPLAYLSEPAPPHRRAQLLARAAGVAPDAPEAPETVLVKVPVGALATSILLSGSTIVGGLFAVAAVVTVAVTRQIGVLFPLVVASIGYVGAVFRSFSLGFDFTVAESPDGLRLRHGLLEHRSQTVPSGRVQATRVVQPLLWRRHDWVKVEVNVAGYGGSGEDSRAAVTSVLLPVAPRALALQVISRLVPGVDIQAVRLDRAPRRTRWLRPVSWRAIACGANDVIFVARRGVFRRELDVIRHEKTQSVRLTRGPIQRALRLATVHVDAAPGPVHVHVPHWDATDARAIVEAQAERARRARQARPPPPSPPPSG